MSEPTREQIAVMYATALKQIAVLTAERDEAQRKIDATVDMLRHDESCNALGACIKALAILKPEPVDAATFSDRRAR